MKMGIEIPLHTSPSAICMFCISVAVKSTGVYSFNKSQHWKKFSNSKVIQLIHVLYILAVKKKPGKQCTAKKKSLVFQGLVLQIDNSCLYCRVMIILSTKLTGIEAIIIHSTIYLVNTDRLQHIPQHIHMFLPALIESLWT